jgi:xanthine dehydrogenase YagR molybdenum-binding subunit
MAGWKKPSESRIIGKPQARLDGPGKVTGKAKYAYDINLPGLLHGRILRSPHAHATIESIDASAAEKMPGVKAVILTANPGAEMKYAGDEIGAVAATTIEIAEDAMRAIKVKYKVLPHAAVEAVAMKADAPPVKSNAPNLGRPNARTQGEVDAAFAQAKTVSEGTYSVAVRTHCSLEPHGVTCRWDDDTHLTCWASTQGVFSVRDELRSVLGIPAENVTVITEVMGGGFGSKFGAGYEGIICARLAKQVGAPVKLLLTRWEEQTSVGNERSANVHIKIAADADGKIVAFDAKGHGTGGASQPAGVPLPYIYSVGASRVEQTTVFTNAGNTRAWRAPGHPPASFLMESALEDLAVKAGIDPLELRLKNDPNAMRQKQWKEGARLIVWERRNPKPGVGSLAGTGRFKRGLGCGGATWGGGGQGNYRARVTINRDGSVLCEHGVQDIGTGTRTYCGMIVAEELGIPVKQVKVEIGKSNLGNAAGSGGSTTTASCAPVIKDAAEKAKAALFEAAAGRMNAQPQDLDCVDGRVVLKSDPTRGVPFAQACSALPASGAIGDGVHVRELQQNGVAGAQFVEVEVDTQTGHVQTVKVVCLQDGGVILNPLTYRSQINGGIIQGIGMALYEDRRMCQLTGRMVNANMEEYKLPGSMEMPEFVSLPFENPDAKGVSGIGEPVVIPTAAAIRNAILNATGAYLYEAPMTPKRVLEALAAARRRGNA